jgi:acyl-CoA synthetase (AMP-forming)/AMP-acid ligase II
MRRPTEPGPTLGAPARASGASEPATLVELVRLRAAEQPLRRAFTFLVDGEAEESTLTYGELDRRARAIAAALQARGAAGERAVLLYPPGVEFITAFLGCLYAGVVAVPAYPPDPTRLARTLPRLEAIVADAGARWVLTTSPLLEMAELILEQAESLRSRTWLATDAREQEGEAGWRDPGVGSDSVAFLQYTSGSTGTPKGVILSHGNLLANSRLIHGGFRHSSRSVGVIWLPQYHDMGLIGGILQPIYGGFPVVLMSPLHFLQRPLRWLEAISRHRATSSGGPNFAYELCIRKSTPEERARLDLSCWDIAFSGAEPVRAQTLERFVEAFAPTGFRASAFYPCYGLAEATLFVTGARELTPLQVRSYDKAALERGEVRPAGGPGERTAALVGCGPAHERLLIVDPETRRVCPPRRVGEIWLSGPSVARGYWERPEETASTFGARAEGVEGAFLRTGDLGFLDEGELFVASRLKDLIILRGRNHYPQDLERAVEESHSALRPGCGAAFSFEVDGEERLVVVHELDTRQSVEPAEVCKAVRRAVLEQHEVAVDAVVLLQPGSIPKTSSGKIQRRQCRAGFLAGELQELHRDLATETSRRPAPVQSGRAERRAHPRYRVRLPATLRWGGEAYEAELSNISAGGCLLMAPESPALADEVSLELPALGGGAIRGRCVRIRDMGVAFALAIAFERPLESPARLAELAAAGGSPPST